METIRLPNQRLDAAFAASEANRDTRTVPMTFYSGAPVMQFNWSNGLHELQLSMDPKHIRLGSLNSGTAPLTMGHVSANDPGKVIGVIESASLEGGKAKAIARFSKRADVDAIYNDVTDGILQNVSLEAKLHKLKETTEEGAKLRSFIALDWEPFAVAVVGLGADPGAHFKASEAVAETDCEVEFAAIEGRATSPQETAMEDTPINTGELARQAADQAKLAERTRVLEINKLGSKLGLAELAATHIENGGSLEDFRVAALTTIAEKQVETRSNSGVTISRDERDTRMNLAGEAILSLVDSKVKPDDQNPFRGMRISRMAEELLNRSGANTRGKNVHEIAEMSMHSTADFPLILADSARKMMLKAYSYATPTYRIWAKKSTAPDFKTMSRLRLGETPAPLKVAEGAQITLGTMTESREQYAILTYGRGLSFTRQMLINDDLGAFNDVVSQFGIQTARFENQTVYAILTANAAMADTVDLFHADHDNLGSGVIANTGLDAAVTAMGTQTGLDGATILNLEPKYLIVPKAKEMTARTAMTAVGPSVKISDQNHFANRFEVVADGVLDATSTIIWYMAADPSIAPGVEYAHLEGAEGPQMIRKENEGAILGVQLYFYIDFGAKAVDWRPLFKSTGV